MLYEQPCHHLDSFLGVRKLGKAKGGVFPLAEDQSPLSNQTAVMREDLARVIPLVETGQGAVEDEVSFLVVLVENGVILYCLSVVS